MHIPLKQLLVSSLHVLKMARFKHWISLLLPNFITHVFRLILISCWVFLTSYYSSVFLPYNFLMLTYKDFRKCIIYFLYFLKYNPLSFKEESFVFILRSVQICPLKSFTTQLCQLKHTLCHRSTKMLSKDI